LTVRTVGASGYTLFGGRDEGVTSGSSAFVAMMESANFRERDDLALLRWLHAPKLRGIFLQNQMRPPAMMISQITFKHVL
jgi:hypothetical protein